MHLKRTAARIKRRRLACVVASVLSLAMIAHAPSASAATVQCVSKISDVAVSPWGTLTIRVVNLGWWYMCDMNSNVTVYLSPNSGNATTITPAVCEAYLAKFLTAKTTQLNVTFTTDFGSTTPPSCSDGYLGQFVAPNPYPYWVDFGG